MSDLEIKLLDNGNLELSLNICADEFKSDNEGREESIVFAELMDYYQANGKYWNIAPEDIGALTSDPYLLTDDFVIEDNGDHVVSGSVWYYNDYMLRSLVNELMEGRTVIMHKAPDVKEEPQTFEQERGMWSINFPEDMEVSESSLEHIAEQIKQGFTSGEVIEEIEVPKAVLKPFKVMSKKVFTIETEIMAYTWEQAIELVKDGKGTSYEFEDDPVDFEIIEGRD